MSKGINYLVRLQIMNTKKMLSIIIPNYNSGKLLKECVESIVNETDESIEIIVVDDGSTDRSIDEIKNFTGIKLIRQPNQGVSVARNTGLKAAKGKYVMFVDADDTLNGNWLLEVKKEIKLNNDLVIFNYNKDKFPQKIVDSSKKLRGNMMREYAKKMVKLPTLYMTVWGKLIKNSLIKDNNLYFDQDIKLSEDGDFIIQCLLKITSLSLNDYCLYNYRNNSSSVMRTFDTEKVENYLSALKKTNSKIPINSFLMDSYSFYIMMHFNLMMVHEVFDVENKMSYFQKRKMLKEVLNEKLVSKALQKIRLRQCKQKQTIPILLVKLKMYDIAALAFSLRSKQNHNK